MHNPLAILCSQLGLSDAALGRVLGCSALAIHEALAAEPREPLATYLRLMAALGAKTRLVVDQPLHLWFDLGAIDALHYSSACRRSLDLDPLPANRGELRRFIKKLRKHRLSYSQITHRLEANFIPTVTGARSWRRSTIGQHLQLKVRARLELMPLGMTDEFRLAFRAHIKSHLLVAICPFDPFASVRYEIQQTERAGKLLMQTQAPLPASIRQWITAAVAGLHWFTAEQWGEEDHGEIQGQVVPGAKAAQLSAASGHSPGAAQAEEGEGSSPLDQHRPAHDTDDLPGPDGRRPEANPIAAGGH